MKNLNDGEGNVKGLEETWLTTKKIWLDTCEEVLGKKTRTHKEWITRETIGLIDARRLKKTKLNNSRTRAAKAEAQQEYKEAHRLVKRCLRKDKARFLDNMADQAEKAARQGHLGDLYRITKKLAGNHKKQENPVKEKV